MARTIEELKLGFDRIATAQACRNLMGKYSCYHTAMRNKDYVRLWADIGDFCHPLEKPLWEYGPDAVYPEDEPAVPQCCDSYPGI